ncbi:nicotinate-nucleotide--dimethylbenzimidazole phosphoribosyltransferase [Streptomyces poonensis]|uniref:Nicotinate-nucleotide--dimethylbenzimidazole phosphoribosyltransferase n=1 Tax=Streptomyces poonensis TaxID=68255 RepID=A0A918PGY9_9ACTN|nr:nicotinate-nucleotide--dimethylbenzimidazole phosphoribosyltransferase [Streptomyces poonensis]GGZ08127.1 hypothetical protein GCM10010365_29150 [Streptomyces poonensis]GLJ88458.1 hypothetical protein GCM10017589_10580 [Streptomyces poonensis]
MTDTGQVPGEGLPESAGMVEQPGVHAPGAYTYLSETSAEDEELLLPGAQGAWGNEVPPPAPEPVVQVVHEPGPHETDGRDSGAVDLSAVRTSEAHAMPEAAFHTPVATPVPQPPVARRPLHLGPPPTPGGSASPVRSLADRGPAGAPTPPAAVRPAAQPTTPPAGPEYLDVPQHAESGPGATPWVTAPVAAPAVGAEVPPSGEATPAAGPQGDAEGLGTAVQAPQTAEAEAEAETAPVVQDEQAGQGENVTWAQDAAQAATAVQDQAVVQEHPAVHGQEPAQDPQPAQDVPVAAQAAQGPQPAQEEFQEEFPAAQGAAEVTEEQEAAAAADEAEAQPVAQPQPAEQEAPIAADPAAPAAVADETAAAPDTARLSDAEPAQGARYPAPAVAEPAAPVEEQVAEDVQGAVPAQQPAPAESGAEPTETAVTPTAAEPSHTAPEPTADQPMGQFVPVDGTVPTAPYPAQPLPAEQPVAAAPAQDEILTATVPGPRLPEAPATTEPAAAEQVAAEQVATQPAPAITSDPTPEVTPEVTLVTAPETDPAPAADAEAVAQSADDLDTRAADQEDQEDQEEEQQVHEQGSTAAVAVAGEATGPAAPGYDDVEREAVLRVMRERRDIRNGFRSDPIPHEVLLRVLEAAHTAPSVGHSQPWDFVVIRSAETRRSMHELAQRQREAYAKSLPKGRAKQFKELKIEAILDTPVNIVVTADPTRGGRHTLGRHTQPQMAPYSSALAVENLWLAARAEGLGVGWVSFFDEREMVRALGLPEHLEVVAYLCVGYVDEFPDEPELMQAGWSKRRPLSWVVHEETYGRRALPGAEPHDLLAETVAGIRPLDAKALGEAWERQKRMTKPAGALGMLEIISAQLSGLSRQCPPPIPEPAAVAVFAGDHGVHAQGVTPWPQEVTAQMVANFLGGGAVCNAFASQVGAEVCVVDVGVAADLPATPGLLPRKVRAGTADMTTGPALTREEVKQAIEVGIETARDLVAAGNKALLTGEMGIANTTASAALISVFTETDPAEVTGRGTGINDETLSRKTEVVRRAIELHQPDPADPIGVLAAFGGLEHAAMVGLLLGGASLRTPVILDGVSAGAAALVARAIAPEVLAACIAGHRSAEPGHVAALKKLGLRPLVDLDLRLGEGTGALLALPMVQSTARAMHEVATFDSAGVTEK